MTDKTQDIEYICPVCKDNELIYLGSFHIINENNDAICVLKYWCDNSHVIYIDSRQ
jgi:hypothetical protein